MALSVDAVTVLDTLELLDTRFLAFADGVAEDRYALWLGSGISFGRVDGRRPDMALQRTDSPQKATWNFR